MVDPGWPQPAPQTLAHARQVVEAHLSSAEAPRKMAQFYDPSGKYAGLTFHTLPPAAPPDPADDDLTAADLLAITLMDVDATPWAVRQLLQEGEVRRAVLAVLRDVPTTVDLAGASQDELDAAVRLYRALKAGLGGVNPWVTASKLAARKRPALIPVRDSVVTDLLGLPSRDVRQDWPVFRHLLVDADVVAGLRGLAATATADHGAPDLAAVPDLRLLDTLLWMRPALTQPGADGESAPGA